MEMHFVHQADDGALAVVGVLINEGLLNLGRQLVKFASMQQEFQQSEFMRSWKALPTW
jgi:carbonic anhydrase